MIPQLNRHALPALLTLTAATLSAYAAPPPQDLLLEAESFKNHGGWVLDTQFISIMGSPYLMAHGMGKPVQDASTTVQLPASGKYHVYVRTKDWVAQWKAPGAPGKFQILINGKPLASTFGTQGAEWGWQDGGTLDVPATPLEVALHDLTGFNGRCDAIYFAPESSPVPPPDQPPSEWRLEKLRLPATPAPEGDFDLVVVGGGYAGMGAAISAARMGCKVALLQDRAVLGGNGSSEIRVWAKGGIRRNLYPNIGEIVEEFADEAKASPGTYEEFGDAKKEAIVRAEKNISLYFNHYVFDAAMRDPAHIASVTALDARTGQRRVFTGKLFVDCTGHATLGAAAKAELTLRPTEHLGMSNMWRWENAATPQSFPETPWALDLTMDDFPYPKRNHAEWFWESGFNVHPTEGLEAVRDWNLRAIFGAFNAMKNRDGRDEHLNAALEWVAYIGGPRESRQLLGDVLLTEPDITEKKEFPDATVPTTWDIDLHYPKEEYAKKFPENPFISKAVFGKGVDRKHGYPVPYRCFYSKNIENMFMAGRNVSVTHEAFGTIRVMKTGGMIGEVVGKAASLCVKNQCTPRDVYARYLPELKELLTLNGAARRETVDSPIKLPEGFVAPGPVVDVSYVAPGLSVKTLEGLVMDDSKAMLTGKWIAAGSAPGYFGEGYHYRPGSDVAAAARYEFKVPKPGLYEVRVTHTPHPNRASNTAVLIESAQGSKTVTVNQRVAGPLPQGFVSLGNFEFAPSKPAAVTIGTAKADGNVHADVVQLLPVK
jgi:hypothetical protein